MTTHSRTSHYGTMNIALHWLTLILMIAIYASIEWHQSLPRGTELRRATEDWHISLGLILLPIALYRFALILRAQIPPITPAPPRWQIMTSKAIKGYLYVLMIGMPVLGWLMLSAEGHSTALFSIPLPAIAPESEALANFASESHEILGTSGYVFMTLHAVAGLYHHYVAKDNTLSRMLPKALRR